VGGHDGRGKKTANSDYETGLTWFNWDQRFVTNFFETTVETMRTELSDIRRPVFVSFNKVVVLVPDSLVSMSRV
jgi:hypothetical protein